jgi:GH15 family glucan-1,4-alpha-glucosidase
MPAHIEDYALLGNCRSAALVSRDGSLDWLCLPRFDAPAVFAALLGNEENGRWRLAPSDPVEHSSRSYLADTLVLETTWVTASGRARVLDFMPLDEVNSVVRIVEGLSGETRFEMDLVMRFDYGRSVPWVEKLDPLTLSAVAGPDRLILCSSVPSHARDHHTVARFRVGAGERHVFSLRHQASHLPVQPDCDIDQALAHTLEHWQAFADRCPDVGPYSALVRRSLLTLKAMTYAPTGGIVAAATTSLPEDPGGSRNWDYRFCWLRDATLTLQSLLACGYKDEAAAWREWLLRAVAGNPADLQIMYGLDGTRRLPEAELPWLGGYEGSKPVRTGNAAAPQLQLDVWGEVLDGLALTRAADPGTTDDSWDIQVALMEYLEGEWDQPDNGLWEMRGPRRKFTHSRVMAWVAADRMVKAVRESGLPGPADRWAALRTKIHNDVMTNGFDEKRNTFVQSYGSTELDASLLLIPRVGFLPHDHPRVIGTVDAIQRNLTQDGFVLRYRPEATDDGLPGTEGVFLACSFWLADALVGIGRRDEAVDLFERLLSLRNDVGLLSEEWDPRNKRQLGNTPQAFSHFPLIHCALQLHHGPHHSNTPVRTHQSGYH